MSVQDAPPVAVEQEAAREAARSLGAWLESRSLSKRALGPLQAELRRITNPEADTRPDEVHPLLGMTPPRFVNELYQEHGGAIGLVRRVGDALIDELRAAIPQDGVDLPEVASTRGGRRRRGEAAAEVAPAAPRRRPRREVAAETAQEQLPLPPALAPDATESLPRLDLPPLLSTISAHTDVAVPAQAPVPVNDDMAWLQLGRLWPTLHPQARRAVILFAAALSVEE